MTNNPTRRKRSWWWLLVAVAVMVGIVAGAVALRHYRSVARPLVCAARLKALDNAIRGYTLPAPANSIPSQSDIMQALVRAGYLNRKQLTCPGGGPFVFVPAAYEAPPDGQVNPRTVIAYEPLSNHGGEGGNILFADGHVEFVRAQACKALIQTATSQPVAD